MSIVNENGDLDFRSNEERQKDKQLKEKLDDIEIRHYSYFKNRKNKLYIDREDNLQCHIWITTQGRDVTIGFIPTSDLRGDIRQEVIKAFNEVYEKPQQED